MSTAMTRKDAKEIIASYYKMSKMYGQINNTLNKTADEAKELKKLVGNSNGKIQNSLLVKAGMALILFPDPTITDLIGSTLIAVGLLKNRNRSLTITDVCKEFQKNIKEMRALTEKIDLFNSRL